MSNFDYNEMVDWDDLDDTDRGNVMRVPRKTRVLMWNDEPVSEMESDHIMNAILWCERKYTTARDTHRKCHGEAFNFYFDSVRHMFPDYQNLRLEWDRRLAK